MRHRKKNKEAIMQFTYFACILGSTEHSDCERNRIIGYVERNRAANKVPWAAKGNVFSLEWSWRNHRATDGTLTKDELKARLIGRGFVFFDTRDEAKAAADKLAAEFNAIIRQVYELPASWPKKGLKRRRSPQMSAKA
jgi:hypothetical protein